MEPPLRPLTGGASRIVRRGEVWRVLRHARRLAWFGRIRTQAQIALAVFLFVLVPQFAVLSYALQRDHALMRAIVEENAFSRRPTDTLSDDLAALSYRIIVVSGSTYIGRARCRDRECQNV